MRAARCTPLLRLPNQGQARVAFRLLKSSGMQRKLLILLLAVFGCSTSEEPQRVDTPPPPSDTDVPPPPEARPPNIVLILTDDLSMDLLPYMPHVQQMIADGAEFRNYFVTDSLCCPSRASLFTGRYPHDTGVFTNMPDDGGFYTFYTRGNEDHTFATALSRAGYRTAMFGKYLNGYLGSTKRGVPEGYVPPGWSDWAVGGADGYKAYDYTLNTNGVITERGHAPTDYLVNVITQFGLDTIADAAATETPFVIELAPFSPHKPSVAAPEDIGHYATQVVPRTASFNVAPQPNEVSWLAAMGQLDDDQIAELDADFRKRLDCTIALDAMVARVRAELVATGHDKDTYVIFTSDNGYHLGQHRMLAGKQTAFDTDIHVPLIVVGPGIPAGRKVDAVVSNIDLCPTFAELGGEDMSATADGHSLAALLADDVVDWRKAVLIEHHFDDGKDDAIDGIVDPDREVRLRGKNNANPPSYQAIRMQDALYVEYANGELEYYDIARDPEEITNLAPTMPLRKLNALHEAMTAIVNCHDSAACWAAEHLTALEK